jgi:hypothetical protein
MNEKIKWSKLKRFIEKNLPTHGRGIIRYS